MSVSIPAGRPLSHPVADCHALSTLVADAQARRASLLADSSLAESHYIQVSQALAAQQSKHAAAVAEIEKALAKSGQEMVTQARKAVVTGADLALLLAVQTRNPNLIAAAVGVDILVDTTDFALQLVEADTGAQQFRAVSKLAIARSRTFTTVLSGPGKNFSRRVFGYSKSLIETIDRLSDSVVDTVRLRSDLQETSAALARIQASVAELPVDLPSWQRFMVAQVEAEIDLYQLLQTDYASSDCRVPTIPGPA